jgi:hypothetical protein
VITSSGPVINSRPAADNRGMRVLDHGKDDGLLAVRTTDRQRPALHCRSVDFAVGRERATDVY